VMVMRVHRRCEGNQRRKRYGWNEGPTEHVNLRNGWKES
jgi:hypothetical protein